MKKCLVLAAILSVAMLGLGLNAYADDGSAQIAALEQQAQRIQDQIKQAQQQCGVSLNNQLKPLSDSVESLVKQRVQLGAQIQQMEGQIQELKQSALSTCQRQVKQHEEEQAAVKQQIANQVAKNKAEAAQKANEAAKQPVPAASAAPAPAATAPAAAAAAPATAGPATATPGAPGFRKATP
jgi:peptidoglycan hydrolase CwlO-like protein